MTKQYHIEQLEADLIHWQHWAEHEQQAIDKCEFPETKPYLEARLTIWQRNVKDIEKALEVLQRDDERSDMENSTSTMAASANRNAKEKEPKEVNESLSA